MKKTILILSAIVSGNLWLSAQCNFTGLNPSYSICDAQVTLTGNPSGGGFSGPGISGNIFNPGSAGIGTHTINYYGQYTVNQVGTFAPVAPVAPNIITLGDDQVSGPHPIGFNFTFYGNTYSNIYISSNGFITFDASFNSGCCSGGVIPSNDAVNNFIAFDWNDLYPPIGGTVSYETVGTAPNRRLLVTWTDINHCCSGGPVNTGQIILYETSNIIEIHSTLVTSDGSVATQGIEGPAGSTGIAVPGRNSVSWTVSNDYVQFAPCIYSQTVTVTSDVLAPSINGPADISIAAAPGTCNATITYTAPSCASTAQVYVNQATVNHDGGNASNILFPNVVADDITIPGGDCWSINKITANFWMTGVPNDATGFNILIYNNNGSIPGTLNTSIIVPAANITSTFIVNSFGYDVYSLSMLLPSSIDLCSGTYWIGIQAVNTENGSDYFWEYVSPVMGGNPAYENYTGSWTSLNNSYTMILENVGGGSSGDVTDNCTTCPTVTLTSGLASGASFPIGTTVVTYQAEDASGNAASYSFNVTVTESIAPVADFPNLSDIIDECSVTTLTAPTATDNCAGLIIGTHDAVLPITSQGVTVVTWTYDDGNGNSITQSQNIVVMDMTAPTPDAATLADVSAECEVTSLTAPTATDNCAGMVMVSNDAVLPINSQGTTVVTWTYEDMNGNISTQTQNLVIADITAPLSDVATLADVTAECEVTFLESPSATDNCSTVIVSNDASLPILANTTVTWSYTDDNGNTSTQAQNIIISGVDASVTANAATLTANHLTIGATFQWIDCDNGNAPIAGETGQSFTATQTGNYAVEVTVGSCTEVSPCEFIDLSGINELSFELINVYPNPSSTVLNIETNDAGRLEFFDVCGKLIFTCNVNAGKTELNVSMLASGTYNVRLTTATVVNTARVVINRQ